MNRYFTVLFFAFRAVIIDRHIAFVGTVNMDMRSFYLNLELTAAIYDIDFAERMSALLSSYASQSIKVREKRWQRRGILSRMKENVMRLAGPIL